MNGTQLCEITTAVLKRSGVTYKSVISEIWCETQLVHGVDLYSPQTLSRVLALTAFGIFLNARLHSTTF